jgi:hypothetical protein
MYEMGNGGIGGRKISFEDLPLNIQQEYGYDPKNASAYIEQKKKEAIQAESSKKQQQEQDRQEELAAEAAAAKVVSERAQQAYAQAKEDYQKAIAKAEEMYQSTKETYDRQNEQSLARHKKEYDTKKRTVDARKQRIEDERNISIKTATEIAISQQKIEILTQMQKMIKVLQVSRNSLEQRDKDRLQPMIELPEPIVTQYVHTTPVPVTPVVPVTIPRPMPDISMLGEDADLLAMREENRARRRERDRKKEEETIVRKPPVYGFVHEFAGISHELPALCRSVAYANGKWYDFSERDAEEGVDPGSEFVGLSGIGAHFFNSCDLFDDVGLNVIRNRKFEDLEFMRHLVLRDAERGHFFHEGHELAFPFGRLVLVVGNFRLR